ncbi:ATP-binding protein [Streptomyces sp. NPDC046821]|uniref:ATP-binding protein n=1 Tax=Streptomyces sp. NPDC046821 TaxID=3154702 RepID=UPI00341004F6
MQRRSPTAAPPDLEVELLAVPKAVPEVREALRRHLGGGCAEVQLCVSELLGNVIRHVGEGTPVRVWVGRVEAGVRVEVTDPDPRVLPVLLRATAEDESGRGLVLLDAVARRWGVEQGPASKTVWCEVDAGEEA